MNYWYKKLKQCINILVEEATCQCIGLTVYLATTFVIISDKTIIYCAKIFSFELIASVTTNIKCFYTYKVINICYALSN